MGRFPTRSTRGGAFRYTRRDFEPGAVSGRSVWEIPVNRDGGSPNCIILRASEVWVDDRNRGTANLIDERAS